jgi:hypothetical protein
VSKRPSARRQALSIIREPYTYAAPFGPWFNRSQMSSQIFAKNFDKFLLRTEKKKPVVPV